MSVISSEVAEVGVSSITETRYCIRIILLLCRTPLVGVRSLVPRTPLPRSDTAARSSFNGLAARTADAATGSPATHVTFACDGEGAGPAWLAPAASVPLDGSTVWI